MKQHIKQTVLVGILTLIGLFGLVAAPSASALTCGGAKTSIIGGTVCNGAVKNGAGSQSAIWAVLLFVLNIMTAGVGILAVGGVVYGSILYASAGSKADQAKKGIETITNVVLGVAAYGLMYLVLNFLIPGGIFQ
jgi:hypothetical protein